MFGYRTSSTCGEACWHAREDVCRCSCGGRNHGILCRGGDTPARMARIGGNFYELIAVIPGPAPGECWADAYRRTRETVAATIAERFPGLDSFGYGKWRPEMYPPIVDRKLSDAQAKWAEVQAVPGACRLVWARPSGTPYQKRNR